MQQKIITSTKICSTFSLCVSYADRSQGPNWSLVTVILFYLVPYYYVGSQLVPILESFSLEKERKKMVTPSSGENIYHSIKWHFDTCIANLSLLASAELPDLMHFLGNK